MAKTEGKKKTPTKKTAVTKTPEPVWRTDLPDKMGWYDVEIDGEPDRLEFFICKMNPKKRYWRRNGQGIQAAVKWIDEPTAQP